MKSIVFLNRNNVDGVIVKGEFSSFGVISVEENALKIPLDTETTLSLRQGSLDTFDQKGQTALAELLLTNNDVGGFLLRLIKAAAQEMVETTK